MTEINPNEVKPRTGIYGVFDEFLKKSVIEKIASFPNDNDKDQNQYIFNPAVLKDIVVYYVKEPNKDKNLKFVEKAEIQLTKIGNEYQTAAKTVFANLMWLQYLPATKPQKDTPFGVSKCEQIKKLTGIKVFYDCNGRAKYGMAARFLDKDLKDLILLFNELVQENQQWKTQNSDDDVKLKQIKDDVKLKQIKEYIIKWCLDLTAEGKPRVKKDSEGNLEKGIRSQAYASNNLGKTCPSDLLPIHNMLLHLCKPQYYDDISVSGHKKKIVETFRKLITKDINKYGLPIDFLDDANQHNQQYYIILNELNKLKTKQKKYTCKNLWSENGETSNEVIGESVKIYDYKWLWNIGDNKEYSDINALKFKKAVILYGPPGTSKTYSAKALAMNLIFQKDFGAQKGKSSDVSTFLAKKGDIAKSQVHRLQLHPNYTYEDFIWGYQIENKEYKNKDKEVVVGNQTVPRKGYFLRLVDEISKENEKNEKRKRTHVLILDEINRVDLSRLFGELFSAIENRDEAVDLPVVIDDLKKKTVLGQKVSQIRIPENLYIIGTMNEIDFSLERVDFALRRRFAWFFYGYSEDTLNDILSDKNKKENSDEKIISKLDDDTQSEYLKSCTALNAMIDKDSDLGEQYQIGHTFFAELVDIWKDMPTCEVKTVKTFLWDMSIGPMIKAYLGNCDEEKIDPFRITFGINPLKSKTNKNGEDQQTD